MVRRSPSSVTLPRPRTPSPWSPPPGARPRRSRTLRGAPRHLAGARTRRPCTGWISSGRAKRAIVGIRSAANNALYVRRQDASGFRSLGGIIAGPPTIVSAGGIAYYFAQGGNGDLYGRTDTA